MRTLGIDEAGRGCVLGPLVVAGFVLDGEDRGRLRKAGAGDSKQIAAPKRIEIRSRLERLGTADLRVIPATAIDAGNLNALEELAIAELVRQWQPDRVIVDALGHPNALDRIVQRLGEAVHPLAPEWVMEPKADQNHPVVGAASIFAKTTRDALLDELRPEWGVFGSGYPHDAHTRRWLADWSRTGRPWPDFVRTRWETVSNVTQGELF